MSKVVVCVCVLALIVVVTNALDNGLGLVPPLGYVCMHMIANITTCLLVVVCVTYVKVRIDRLHMICF